MTIPPLPRLLPCLLSLLAFGCGSIGYDGPDEVEPDQGHTELLPGYWRHHFIHSHTLEMGRDSTFRECVERRLLSISSTRNDYCVQGRYSMGTSDPVFRPARCDHNDTLIECDAMNLAMGDTATRVDSLLITLLYREKRFYANVIINRICADWEDDIFGQVCVRQGAPTGTLDLILSVSGAPWGNNMLQFQRQNTSRDSL